MTQSKDAYLLSEFRRIRPTSYAIAEKHWDQLQREKALEPVSPSAREIDWTKPLVMKTARDARIDLRYIESVYTQQLGQVHIVEHTYHGSYTNSRMNTYYVMHDSYGKRLGDNVARADIMNAPPKPVTKYTVYSTIDGSHFGTYDTRAEAKEIVGSNPYYTIRPFTYVPQS